MVGFWEKINNDDADCHGQDSGMARKGKKSVKGWTLMARKGPENSPTRAKLANAEGFETRWKT